MILNALFMQIIYFDYFTNEIVFDCALAVL